MFIYGTLGIIQGMFFTYLSSTLSTLERQFGIKSKETAYLMSGNEVSQILFVFVMPLIVKVKRRPLWTALGLFCTSLGCFAMALPHWLVGNQDKLAFKAAYGDANSTVKVAFCGSNDTILEGTCDSEGNRVVDWSGLIVLYIGILLTGIGNCAFYSFGVAYLDDNTSHDNSPIMLALTFTFRLLGPTLGFMLGSFCLTTYVTPSTVLPEGVAEGHPAWIGAWWLGFPIIGAAIFIVAAPLVLFPQRLSKKHTDAAAVEEANEADAMAKAADKPDGGTFVAAVKRLLANKLFMFNFFSALFYVFAFMGFGTFMPKYMEFQFRMKGSTSSRFAGGIGTLSKAIGMLASGFVIARLKPSARILSGWNVVLGALFLISLISFAFLGCPTSKVAPAGNACALGCECAHVPMQPVCSKDGVTNFYSPCAAGCKTHAGEKVFGECACAREEWEESNATLSEEWVKKDLLAGWRYHSQNMIKRARMLVSPSEYSDEVSNGWCPVDCGSVFSTFGTVMFVLMVLGSTGRIGNVLVALRCIDVRDKSLSMAFNVVFLSLLAMLPAPMVFGAIIDSSCMVWQRECGEDTNCVLYNNDTLRMSVMLTTAAIMSGGILFDIGVWYHAGSLVIFRRSRRKSEQSVKQPPQSMFGSAMSLNKGIVQTNTDGLAP